MISLLTLLLIAVVTIPVSKEFFDKLSLEKTINYFDLLTKIVSDAVDYVEQVSSLKDTTSEDKKAMAVELAKNIAANLKIPEKHYTLIDALIESTLWGEDQNDEDPDIDEFE